VDPRRWRETEQIFLETVECGDELRAARLGALDRDDPAMAAEVRRTIEAAAQGDGFLESSAMRLSDDEVADPAPERIGPWRVLSLISRGGMGSVYLAVRDDGSFHREVAIKLIRRGFDSVSIVRRFRRERQILASLDHPNIARLLDGGAAADGLPYLVMEYIAGEPMTQWCEQKRATIVQRLRLFQDVCRAVHYAHQRLVAHLDIKPANILVTEEGVPRLLDFGIARVLEGDTENGDTTSMPRPITPDYASPEQIRGESPTAASDIYSLGVLLYELLCGERPWRLSGLSAAEMSHAIEDREPCRPGAVAAGPDARLRWRIPPDLDHIVLRAMRSDPRWRYSSAAELAEDIERHLNGLPIIARRQTFSYLATRFLRRHKAGVAASTLVCLSLVAGLVSTSWQARVAARQRALAIASQQKAEQRLNDTLRLTHSLLFDYYDSVSGLSGSTAVRLRLVRDTMEYLDELARESGDSVPVQRQIAAAWLRIGDVQGRPYAANLGDTAGALFSYRRAIALLTPLAGSDPLDRDLQSQLADGYADAGRLLMRMLDYAGASDDLHRSIVIRERLAAIAPSDTANRSKLASAWQTLGDVLFYQNRLTDAFRAEQRAEQIWRQLAAKLPADTSVSLGLAASEEGLGAAYENSAWVLDQLLGDRPDALRAWQEALRHYRLGLALVSDLALRFPQNADIRRQQADLGVYTARMLARTGKPGDAIHEMDASLALFGQLSADDPQNREWRLDLLDSRCDMAVLLVRTGSLQSALPLYWASIASAEKLLNSDPGDHEWRQYFSTHLDSMFRLLADESQAPQALLIERRKLAFDQATATLYGWRSPWRYSVVTDMAHMAHLLALKGRKGESQTLAQNTFAIARRDAHLPDADGSDLGIYGTLLLDGGPSRQPAPSNAIVWLTRAMQKDPNSFDARARLARVWLKLGDRNRAEALVQQVVDQIPWPEEARQNTAIQRDLDWLASRNR
jgi:eukaryotic-like serine/threonine-protein kinase